MWLASITTSPTSCGMLGYSWFSSRPHIWAMMRSTFI